MHQMVTYSILGFGLGAFYGMVAGFIANYLDI